jgi:hypothetical protein
MYTCPWYICAYHLDATAGGQRKGCVAVDIRFFVSFLKHTIRKLWLEVSFPKLYTSRHHMLLFPARAEARLQFKTFWNVFVIVGSGI